MADVLRDSSVPGETVVWRDMGAYAPTPADDETLARMQGEMLVADGFFETVDGALQARRSGEERLARACDHDEVVLWFDPCLYDHVILVQRLTAFAAMDAQHVRFSVVCVRENLGHNTPSELAGLFPDREPVRTAQFELAVRAWQAYRSPDPEALSELLAGDTSALPGLAAAFTDHLERYPSTRDGLGAVDRAVLEHASRLGRTRLSRLIGSSLADLMYLSDTLAERHAREMTFCRHPMLRLHDGPEWPVRYAGDIEITPQGRAVLAGDADFVALNGIDRWLGGVHLMGAEAQWRWDPEQRRLVASSPPPPG